MKKILFIAGVLITTRLLSQQVSYNMTGDLPITMTSMGTGTYNQTIFYHNLERGLTIDLSKKVDDISATPIDFNINARGGLNPFLTIKGNNGNMGIGTNNPVQKLDVQGNILAGSTHSTEGINAFAIRYENGSLSNWGSLRSSAATYMSFGAKADHTTANAWLSTFGNTNFIKVAMAMDSDGIRFLSSPSQINPLDTPVTMKDILTISPNGNASLQGKFEAKELKVTLTPTADFVFEENYALPKLEEVAKYIKEKKHLPEIASAKVMEKEGVNVGEFQIKLLQKIEELTLYVIEQNKQLKDQQEKIQSLKIENSDLKNAILEIQQLKEQFLKKNTSNNP